MTIIYASIFADPVLLACIAGLIAIGAVTGAAAYVLYPQAWIWRHHAWNLPYRFTGYIFSKIPLDKKSRG